VAVETNTALATPTGFLGHDGTPNPGKMTAAQANALLGLLLERTLSAGGGTIIASDSGKRIVCTAAGTHTVSNAATLGTGFECEVVNDSGGNVILDGPGGTNVTMADQEVVTIICCNSKVRCAKGASTVI
jgi:hypothetical protein